VFLVCEGTSIREQSRTFLWLFFFLPVSLIQSLAGLAHGERGLLIQSHPKSPWAEDRSLLKLPARGGALRGTAVAWAGTPALRGSWERGLLRSRGTESCCGPQGGPGKAGKRPPALPKPLPSAGRDKDPRSRCWDSRHQPRAPGLLALRSR